LPKEAEKSSSRRRGGGAAKEQSCFPFLKTAARSKPTFILQNKTLHLAQRRQSGLHFVLSQHQCKQISLFEYLLKFANCDTFEYFLHEHCLFCSRKGATKGKIIIFVLFFLYKFYIGNL
jgi:hypothetical protein